MDLAQIRAEVERRLKETTWSARELAKQAGLSPSAVHHFLKDTHKRPEYETVVGICVALGLMEAVPLPPPADSRPQTFWVRFNALSPARKALLEAFLDESSPSPSASSGSTAPPRAAGGPGRPRSRRSSRS